MATGYGRAHGERMSVYSIFPDSIDLPPFPPLNQSTHLKTVELSQLVPQGTRTRVQSNSKVYDITDCFVRSFNENFTKDEKFFEHKEPVRIGEVFTALPLKTDPEIDWNSSNKYRRLRDLLYGINQGIVEPPIEERTGVLTIEKMIEWFRPNLHEHGLPKMIHGDFRNTLITSKKHFEQAYIYKSEERKVNCSRFHYNFIVFDGPEEKHFLSFVHRLFLDLNTREISYSAHIITHQRCIGRSDLPFLLQNQPEALILDNPFPVETTNVTKNNMCEVLSDILPPYEIKMDKRILEKSKNYVQIIDCTAGFDDLYRADTGPIDMQVVVPDIERTHHFNVSDGIEHPRKGESKQDWFRRILKEFHQTKTETPADTRYHEKLLSWITQAVDAYISDMLMNQADLDKKSKLIVEDFGKKFAVVYLTKNLDDDLGMTIVRGNYCGFNPMTQRKQGGYFTMIRSALFKKATDDIGFKVHIITHGGPIDVKNISGLFINRPEAETTQVRFT